MTFREIRPDEFDEAVAQACLPVLRQALATADKQHRLRVVDLPTPVMRRLCVALQGDDRWEARLLCARAPKEAYEAKATKLVELRDHLPKPLVVFLPTGVRTAAEDSLDIATFRQMDFGSILQVAVDQLAATIIEEASKDEPGKEWAQSFSLFLDEIRQRKLLQDQDTFLRYLLTWRANGSTPEAAGASLFVLGLVPDFELFSRGGQIVAWVTRNQKAVATLSDLRRPLQERVQQLSLQPNSIQPLLFKFVRAHLKAGRRQWTTAIATDPAWRELGFERWPFEDAGTVQDVRLLLDELPLPKQTEDKLTGAVPMKVWDLSRGGDLKVAFRSAPAPSDVEAWKTYRFQILEPGEEAPNLLWESANFAKPKRNAKVSRTIKAKDISGHLKEGAYYLRVEAFGVDGSVLTKAPDPSRKEKGLRPENESDLFLIVDGDVLVEPPKEPRKAFSESLLAAWFDIRGTALLSPQKHRDALPTRESLTGLWDAAENAAVRDEVRFEISAEGAQGRTIRMPGLLRKVEYTILRNPDHLAGYMLDLRDARDRADLVVAKVEGDALDTPEAAAFLKARRTLFTAILDQHASRNSAEETAKKTGVVEVVDLLALEPSVLAYAETWFGLCDAVAATPPTVERSRQMGLLARLDLVNLRWRRSPADPGRGSLLAPTHPLRLCWHLQHARVRHEGISLLESGEADVPDRSAYLDALARQLFPANLPLVLFDTKVRALIEQDLLTPFWPLYLPADSDARHYDVNYAREQARRLLGVRQSSARPGEIPPGALAERVFDYLRRHPYIEQLKINVFNPGEGERVAETLREVEALRRSVSSGSEPPELRYAVHLFSAKEYIERSGEAVDALLDPERQVAEDDEFTLGAANHLRPKLLIARSTHEEFARRPEDFRAHLTLLLEQFRVDGRLANVTELARGTFVRGLVVESETRLEAQAGRYGWIRGVHPVAPSGADAVERLLVEGTRATQQIHAGAAGGKGGSGESPVVALYLDPEEHALLRSIDDVSDQVLTIDRNLGLDYYDSASRTSEVGYLLDFSPTFLQGDGERLLVTTRCTDELVSFVVPALDTAGLKLPRGKESAVIEALRSISGRIALRLLSGHAATQETIGLLLARWLLESAGLLSERILVPIDSHQDWFVGEGSQQRADLMLVDFEPLTRTIDIHVVEVKARTHLAASERAHLYEEMHEQADNTRVRFLKRFDFENAKKTRVDVLLRAKELFSLLLFYLGRAHRYGLVSEGRAREVRDFLGTLDQGYRLRMRMRGVVFAGDCRGQHLDEDEPMFPVHRFGLDTAQRLLDAAVRSRDFGSESNGSGGTQDTTSPAGPPAPALDANAIDGVRTFFGAPKRAPLQDVPAQAPQETRVEPEPISVEPEHQRTEIERPHEVAESPPEKPAPEPLQVAPTPQVPSADRPAPERSEPPKAETPGRTAAPPTTGAARPDILLGASEATPQHGLFGRFGSAKVGLDLTGCNTISLFGVQGFGKSYTLGVIAEMGAQPMPGINELPAPLATVVFHYHRSDAYEPEYATAVAPNDKAREVERLLAEYQARPEGLRDVVLLVPEAKLEKRQKEYPNVEVHPIHFSSSEIGADGWKFLMGAVGNSSLYVRQIIDIMQSYGGELTIADLEREIAESDFSKSDLRLANNRLRLAKRFIRDGKRLRDILRPGRTVIVDMRDEWLEKEQALGLFLVLMHTFAQAEERGRLFNKLMVFDEAHKYITESELIGEVVSMIREMRHWATSVVIASQDPLSVPSAVLALTSILVLHRITAPEWIKHLRKAIIALEDVSDTSLANLAKGEALVWARLASDSRFTQKPQKVYIRPRVTQHGGGTKTAVEGATVR